MGKINKKTDKQKGVYSININIFRLEQDTTQTNKKNAATDRKRSKMN